MKNRIKLLGIIILVVISGLTFATCNDGSTDGQENNNGNTNGQKNDNGVHVWGHWADISGTETDWQNGPSGTYGIEAGYKYKIKQQ